MTTLSNSEGRALLAKQTGKGKAKADKPPPIKMPKPDKPDTLKHQLDRADVEREKERFTVRPPEGAYVEEHPTYNLYITNGITFILKPLE